MFKVFKNDFSYLLMQIKSKQFELNEFNELKSLTTSKLALTIANENAYDVFWCCIIRSKPPLSSIHPLKKQHRVKQHLYLEYIILKHIIKSKSPTSACCPCIRGWWASSGPIFCADSEFENRIDLSYKMRILAWISVFWAFFNLVLIGIE